MNHKKAPITVLIFIILATLGLGCQSTKKITGGVNIGQEQLVGTGATELPGTIYISASSPVMPVTAKIRP